METESSASTVSLVWEEFEQRFGEENVKLYSESESKDFEFSFEASSPIFAHPTIVKWFCTELLNSASTVQNFHFENPDIEMRDLACVLDFMYMGNADVETERLHIVQLAAETIGFKEMVAEINYTNLKNVAIDMVFNKPDD